MAPVASYGAIPRPSRGSRPSQARTLGISRSSWASFGAMVLMTAAIVAAVFVFGTGGTQDAVSLEEGAARSPSRGRPVLPKKHEHSDSFKKMHARKQAVRAGLGGMIASGLETVMNFGYSVPTHDLNDGGDECVCEVSHCYACYTRAEEGEADHGEHDEHHDEHHDDHEEHHDADGEEHHDEPEGEHAKEEAAAKAIPASLHEEHGEHGEHGHEEEVDSLIFFDFVPACCHHAQLTPVSTFDSSYNMPCFFDEIPEDEDFGNYGETKLCSMDDMKEAQSKTHQLSAWAIILGCIVWIGILVAINQVMHKYIAHHDHHGHDHHHDDHEHGEHGEHGDHGDAAKHGEEPASGHV